MAKCFLDCMVNDYFLHIISVAPKSNSTLLDVISTLHNQTSEAVECGALDGAVEQMSQAINTVQTILRGLLALLSPKARLYKTTARD